ncbi:glycosyl hydrolase, partial [Aspergillus karnatakaensis]|uniref:glycosyl hydrolase n=1 Tax=Aspergillus karnatakaensis TaxID=1810916 RepID=UPI003CCD42B2
MRFSLPLSSILTLALSLSPLSLVQAQYSAPGACSGDCWGHDPGFQQRVSDGRYYRFSTGGGIQVHASNNLDGPWERLGEALPGGSIEDHPGRTHLWAPDIHYSPTTNLYYMYYSISTLGSRNSIIATASSPTLDPGTWTDHGGLFRTAEGGPYNAIDANHLTIDNKQYLNFGSYWNGIHQVDLENSLTLAEGAAARQIAYNSTGNNAIEAAYVFYRRGWFYLTFSAGRANGYVEDRPAVGEEYRVN